MFSTERFLLELLLVIGSGLLSVYVYFKYCYTYWAKKGVPYLEPSFPLGKNNVEEVIKKSLFSFVGNNEIIGSESFGHGLEASDWYKSLKKMGVKFGGVYNFCNKVLVLVDLDLIKNVTIKQYNSFLNREFYSNVKHFPETAALFLAETEDWRFMRHKMTPMFTSAKMRYIFDCVNKCSLMLEELCNKAASSKDYFNLRLFIDKFTMDNIGVVVFGLEFNCLLTENTKFREIADKARRPDFSGRFQRLASRIAPGLSKILRIQTVDKGTIHFLSEMVRNNVETRRKSNIRRNDVTQLFMDLQENNESNKKFTMNELIGNSIGFFLAGFDTSSKTMQFTLLELARNQALQDKIRQHIQSVLKKYDGELTYEGLQEMTFLRQAVDETLRLYPPVLTISRIATEDCKLEGTDFVVEKGTTIVVPVIGLHRDPDLFPNPEKYDPERFSVENKSNIKPNSYLPFGDGPRNCIGKRFGLMQVQIGLVKILNSFRIEVNPNMKYPLEIGKSQFLLETKDIYAKAIKL
ncbi:hypothetical protein ABEB36_008108 [Hypothenemus hampei]|uniref:Cytochrome P450 n=1 Tax=Hypothenemus hampei TaxID=57062 RepID=A0ABD1EKT2_HYPHA